MTIKHCRACDIPLINKRSHATTCSSKCRMSAWRQSRITMLPVTIMLNLTNFALVTKAASAAGVPITQFAHDQLVQTMDTSQW